MSVAEMNAGVATHEVEMTVPVHVGDRELQHVVPAALGCQREVPRAIADHHPEIPTEETLAHDDVRNSVLVHVRYIDGIRIEWRGAGDRRAERAVSIPQLGHETV